MTSALDSVGREHDGPDPRAHAAQLGEERQIFGRAGRRIGQHDVERAPAEEPGGLEAARRTSRRRARQMMTRAERPGERGVVADEQ